jgi:hypothetical protein
VTRKSLADVTAHVEPVGDFFPPAPPPPAGPAEPAAVTAPPPAGPAASSARTSGRASGNTGARTATRPSARRSASPALRASTRTDARPRGRAREDSASLLAGTWRRMVEVEARKYAAMAARLEERDTHLAAAVNAALAAGMAAEDVRAWLDEAGATAGTFPAGTP